MNYKIFGWKISLILAEARDRWSYGIYDLGLYDVYYKLFSLKSSHT